MAASTRITEKGIAAYSPKEPGVPEKVFAWLQQLQLIVPRVSTYSASINPSSVAANSELDETYTVTGLNTNDIVTVNPPEMDAGLGIMYARVSAANTLKIRWRNFTGSGIDPASGTYLILAVRK